jgi:branched-chain amino acid aminotransferase
VFSNTRGELCEGTGSNVFFVRAGLLHTPPLSSGCLAGVTRALTLELARESGIALDEGPVAATDWLAADEAFLTSTTREIQPIRAIDDRHLADRPGAITAQLIAAWRELIASGEGDP